jgi:hypothetical protein
MLRHERVLFGIATVAGLAHAVDEVFLAREAYRAIPVAILSVAVLLAYRRLSPVVRGGAAVVFGLFWLGGILTHWVPLARDGASPGDWTSFASVPGGILFLVLGIAVVRGSRVKGRNEDEVG